MVSIILKLLIYKFTDRPNNYLILIVNKNGYVTYNEDLLILNVIDIKEIKELNIYYVVLDNLKVEIYNEGINNYLYYLKKGLLVDLVGEIKNKTKDKVNKLEFNIIVDCSKFSYFNNIKKRKSWRVYYKFFISINGLLKSVDYTCGI